MRKTLYIIFAIITLASCDIRFELNLPKEDSKIYAFCAPGARDTTAIIVELARFVGDSISFDLSKVEIDLRVNGESQEVQFQPKYTFPYGASYHSVPEEAFYFTRKLQSDDEVSLTVSYHGLESVSAVTNIPQQPEDATFRIETGDDSAANFILEYSDQSEETYYAAIFREKLHEFKVWGYIEENGEVITDTTDYTSWQPHHINHELDTFQESDFNFEAYNNQTGVLFWKNSDAIDNGEKKMVYFSTYILKDVEEWYNELNYKYLDFSYEATIYRITEDLYRFYLTNLMSNENRLSYLGLSRNNATYTNINNGFGVLGGMAGHTMMYDTTISDKENYLPEVY